jgi:oligopeptide transport system substrate-binding protein
VTTDHQTETTQQEWWNDEAQKRRFLDRFSGTPMGRRGALGLISAFATGAIAIACGQQGGGGSSTGGATTAGQATTAAGLGQATGNEKLAREQVFRSTVTDEPATFDYNFNLYAAASSYVSEGLLRYDADNNAVPGMAESFTVNQTGDVFTFKIRRDAKWSNGEPLRAADFIYSWTRRLDPNSGANYAAFLYDIKGAEAFNKKQNPDPNSLGLKAIDEFTLEVTLQQPAGYFPVLVAYTAAVPVYRKGAEQWGQRWGTDDDKFVGNGPFKLQKWEHNKSFEIVKNEHYWKAKDIKLEKVSYLIVKQDQRVPTYENNEIDWVPSANIGDFRRLSSDAKLSKEIFKFDQVGSWYLSPNPRFKPFDNVKVRQAMAFAIDRDKLVKDVLQGLGTVAYSQNSPGTPFYNPNKFEQYTGYDPKKAMDMLRGTEYEGGRNWPKITMSMRNNEADAHKAAMAAIIQMLKENLGMTVESEVGDPQVVYREMWQGNKQLMWLRWYMDYPDANNTNFECFYSKIPAGSRRSWWENDEFDRLVVQAKGEPNMERRKQLYAQSDEILVKDAGAIFLYYPNAYGLLKPKMKGMPVNKQGAVVPDWNIFIRMLDTMYVVEA